MTKRKLKFFWHPINFSLLAQRLEDHRDEALKDKQRNMISAALSSMLSLSFKKLT